MTFFKLIRDIFVLIINKLSYKYMKRFHEFNYMWYTFKEGLSYKKSSFNQKIREGI